MREMNSAGPAPPNGKGARQSPNPVIRKTGRAYHSSEPSANDHLGQLKAEASVRKFSTSPTRDDAIPFCLRTLERAQRELRHDGLALAISAAEWNFVDLTIWRSYPAKFARAEAWKHIGIGIEWIQHLRRKRGVQS